MNSLDRKFCIAPMMEWTDRHCRFFHRLLTRRALIYTEMITTGAVLHGNRARLLGYDPAEHPLAVQLGGSDPRALAETLAWALDAANRAETATIRMQARIAAREIVSDAVDRLLLGHDAPLFVLGRRIAARVKRGTELILHSK